MRIKSTTWKGIAPLLAFTSLSVLAEDYQPLDLPCYYAQAVPCQYGSLNWLNRFYITGKFGPSFANISDIENVSPPVGGATPPPVATTSVSQTVPVGGVAIGYTIRRGGGIFSRIEVEYLKRGDISYNTGMVFAVTPPPTTTLQSTISNQTIMGKIYWDFRLCNERFVPYIQAGAGGSFNSTVSNGTFVLVPGALFTSSTITNDTSNFGWEVGLGSRFELTKHVILDVGYEFEGLGKVDWTINTLDPANPTLLQGNLYSNTVLFGITLAY